MTGIKSKSMRLPAKEERWRYRRAFWMAVGLVLGVWMAVVVVGWFVYFL
jgi:hypothetical protein